MFTVFKFIYTYAEPGLHTTTGQRSIGIGVMLHNDNMKNGQFPGF